MISLLEDILWRCVITFALISVIAAMLFIPYWLYKVATAETFSLIKADWVCSRKETRNTIESTVTSNGSVVVVPSTTAICVQYNLKSAE